MRLRLPPYPCVALVLMAALGGCAGNTDKTTACRIERQASLPITLLRSGLSVPAAINGKQVNLIVDTGAERSLITPAGAAELGLQRVPHGTARVIGTGGSETVNTVRAESLTFGGLDYGSMALPVVELPVPARARDAGLIGADVLSDFDVEIDFPARTLSLYRIDGCSTVKPPWTGSYATVPAIVTYKHRFMLPLAPNGHHVTAIFDTGADTEALSASSASRLGMAADDFQTDVLMEKRGAGNLSNETRRHQFAEIAIADHVFQNPRIGVANFEMPDADMLLGRDYMASRRFWLSYATHVLYIQSRPVVTGAAQ